MNITRRISLGLIGVGVVAGAIALPLAFSPAAIARDAERNEAAGGSYQIDPVHSSLIFKIKHMGASNFYGRINGMSGSFTVGDTASFDVSVKAENVDTGNSKRDSHVKSPDFFNAKEFSEIKFSGKDFKKSGDAWKGTGNLTFRGVTRPIELSVAQTGTGKGMDGGELVGVETTFTIKRSDFGNSTMVGPLSDDVTLIVALEGGAKK